MDEWPREQLAAEVTRHEDQDWSDDYNNVSIWLTLGY